MGIFTIFPRKTLCAHVTTWNKKASIKFRTEVAMMGKLGFDIKLSDLTQDELTYCNAAIKNYNRLKPTVLDGNMYRLVSPYEGNHTSTMFVSKDKSNAVLFAFDIYPRYAEKLHNVLLEGLDSEKLYMVNEINLVPGQNSPFKSQVYSGDYLMKVGLNVFTGKHLNSRVIEIIRKD